MGRSVTLRDLMAAHPGLFYAQTWYAGEAFLDAPLDLPLAIATPHFVPALSARGYDTVPALVLATLYVQDPSAPIWAQYLWTSDHDRHGQRVYMGVNDGKMEIHRHIHLTERFGVPVVGRDRP